MEGTGEEAYDASIGGQKGLLYVGRRDLEEGGGGDGGGEGAVRFVSARDGATLLSLGASRILSCSAKGRYRMLLSYADVEGGERRLCLVRVHGTAVDRVIGVVLELADAARAAKAEADVDGGASGGRVPAARREGNGEMPSYRPDDAGAVAGGAAADSSTPGAASGTPSAPDSDMDGQIALSNSAPE